MHRAGTCLKHQWENFAGPSLRHWPVIIVAVLPLAIVKVNQPNEDINRLTPLSARNKFGVEKNILKSRTTHHVAIRVQ